MVHHNICKSVYVTYGMENSYRVYHFKCCVIEWHVCVLIYICKIWIFEVCSYFNVCCKRYCIHAWLLYTVKSVQRGEQEYWFHMVFIVATCSDWDYRPNHQVLTITLFVAWLHILWPHWWCAVGLPLALVIASLYAQTFEQVSFVQCEKRQSTVRGMWMTLL